MDDANELEEVAEMPARLFERQNMPVGQFSEQSLDYLDELVEHLRSRRVSSIKVEQGDRGKAPSMVRSVSQGYLHRCVELAEATAALCNQQKWLSAIVVARSLVETVAAYYHHAKKIERAASSGRPVDVYDAATSAAFATRDEELLATAGEANVVATNILTQLAALRERRESIVDDYNLLSEHGHPNGLGVFLFYGRTDVARSVVEFRPGGWEPGEAFKWAGVALYIMRSAIDAADKMEAVAQDVATRDEQRSSPTS